MTGVVFHFSEDPTIPRFEPHVAATAADETPLVWAIDADNAPLYWFPRDCPRACAWGGPHDLLGPGTHRVHAIEFGWLAAMQHTTVYRYRLPDETFRSLGHFAMVSEVGVSPLGPPEPMGNLIDLHAAARIELRLMANLWPFWDAVLASTLQYSGIRLHNALPRR